MLEHVEQVSALAWVSSRCRPWSWSWCRLCSESSWCRLRCWLCGVSSGEWKLEQVLALVLALEWEQALVSALECGSRRWLCGVGAGVGSDVGAGVRSLVLELVLEPLVLELWCWSRVYERLSAVAGRWCTIVALAMQIEKQSRTVNSCVDFVIVWGALVFVVVLMFLP